MARANRHFISGHIWHLTHRCHKREFLFKFSKDRKGAFWEDRYHSTAIESGEHLWRCLVDMDLNMVRAGVVEHPSEWKWSGYQLKESIAAYGIVDPGHPGHNGAIPYTNGIPWKLENSLDL